MLTSFGTVTRCLTSVMSIPASCGCRRDGGRERTWPNLPGRLPYSAGRPSACSRRGFTREQMACWCCIMASPGDAHRQTRSWRPDPGRGHRQTSQDLRRGAQDRRPSAMSDMQREALAVLADVWAWSPDVRLGQLMAHLEFLGQAHVGKSLGYIDDD